MLFHKQKWFVCFVMGNSHLVWKTSTKTHNILPSRIMLIAREDGFSLLYAFFISFEDVEFLILDYCTNSARDHVLNVYVFGEKLVKRIIIIMIFGLFLWFFDFNGHYLFGHFFLFSDYLLTLLHAANYKHITSWQPLKQQFNWKLFFIICDLADLKLTSSNELILRTLVFVPKFNI